MSIRMKVRPVVHDANDEDVLWRIAAELGFRKGCQAHSYRRFELRSIGYGFLRRYSDSQGGNEAKSPDDLLFAVYPRRVHCPQQLQMFPRLFADYIVRTQVAVNPENIYHRRLR